VGNCSDQDRLSAEWQKAVASFADAVAQLPKGIGDSEFWERYENGRAAGEQAESAYRALELHRQTHQCKLTELNATEHLTTLFCQVGCILRFRLHGL
jgi:hypothetical protein